ncbi:MAG: carboxypeptidase-like regulatory domain-containing protein [Bacteroidales bacterium]
MKSSVSFLGVKRIVVLAVVVLFSATSFSKSSCCVKVKVTDNHYQPLDFAKITLKDAATQKVLKVALSDENGELKLKKLHAGKYIIDVKTPGFGTNKENSFTVSEDSPKMIDKLVVLELDFIEQQQLKDNVMNVSSQISLPDYML